MGMRGLWDPGSPKQGIPVGVFSIEGVEWREGEPKTEALKMFIIFFTSNIITLCRDLQLSKHFYCLHNTQQLLINFKKRNMVCNITY